jgi:hypothetical protein
MTKLATLVTIKDTLNGRKTAIHPVRKYPMVIIPPFRDVRCDVRMLLALSGQRSSMLTANYFSLTRSKAGISSQSIYPARKVQLRLKFYWGEKKEIDGFI